MEFMVISTVTTSLEFNILRLYDFTILGFFDQKNPDSQETFTKFEKAASHKKCQGIMFVKAELEDAKEVFEEYKVESTPAFLFFKSGVQTDELRENDPKQLQKKILELMK